MGVPGKEKWKGERQTAVTKVLPTASVWSTNEASVLGTGALEDRKLDFILRSVEIHWKVLLRVV
jgi:hypothetical protein